MISADSPRAKRDRPIRRRSAAVLLVAVMALLLGLGGRLVYINVELRDRLLTIAERQRRSSTVVPARRGMILDRRGRVVAATEYLPDVFVDPARIGDIDELAALLGPPLNLPADRVKQKILARPGSQYVVLATRVDDIAAKAVRALNHVAVGLDEHPVRTYPLGESMAHVLGWVGSEGTGMDGIELAFDQHLRGKDGRRGTIRDARRRGIMPSDESPIPPVDGGHVVLTADAEIQRITEVALARGVDSVKAQSGVAVVMSPATGAVLAMACYPSFDPVNAARTPPKIRRNQAVTDPTEPGSTFKPFIVCKALEGSYVSTTELIDCHMGRHHFGSREIVDAHPYGMLDLKGILTHSSNIGMVTIAERMGNPALYEIVRRFGFGEKTGIDFPGESDGVVRPLRKWGRLTTQSVAIGYEISVTPLQLVTAFSAIANDGILLRPRLVHQLLGPDGLVVRENENPVVVGRAVPSNIARRMSHEFLASVVEDGSGKAAKLEGYRVLGKTGTAKLPFENRKGYETGAYMGAFMGAAPLRERGAPELAVVVMIRRPDPTLGYYGGAISAPVVGEILQHSLAYLEVPPDDESVASVSQP
jgi:cell division protein FtsI (penicillin-binding protein 3)